VAQVAQRGERVVDDLPAGPAGQRRDKRDAACVVLVLAGEKALGRRAMHALSRRLGVAAQGCDTLGPRLIRTGTTLARFDPSPAITPPMTWALFQQGNRRSQLDPPHFTR
jgi:hypothetical protein